eukprot:5674360-Pyramimonas_sp.AAC.1
MQDGTKFCWSDDGVLLSEGNSGIIEPYYISHVEDLATGRHWCNPEYLGIAGACPPRRALGPWQVG